MEEVPSGEVELAEEEVPVVKDALSVEVKGFAKPIAEVPSVDMESVPEGYATDVANNSLNGVKSSVTTDTSKSPVAMPQDDQCSEVPGISTAIDKVEEIVTSTNNNVIVDAKLAIEIAQNLTHTQFSDNEKNLPNEEFFV